MTHTYSGDEDNPDDVTSGSEDYAPVWIARPGHSTQRTRQDAREIVERISTSNAGQLRRADWIAMAQHPDLRLFPVLVRCGSFRVTLPAQDVETFLAIVKAEGTTYVRDVCLLAGWRGQLP